MKPAFALLLCLTLAGCGASWTRVKPVALDPTAHRQVVQVWSGGRAKELHALRLTDDTVSGVPFFQDPGCERCRIAIPMRQVDSMRVGDPMDNFTVPLGILGLISLIMLLVTCGSGYCDGYST